MIGVNSAAMAKGIGNDAHGSVGVGFAIPSSLVGRLLPEMISGDLRTRPWLGVTATDQRSRSDDQAMTSEAEGARLLVVMPDSPADEAQLEGARLRKDKGGGTLDESGDLITAIDDVKVKSVGDLASYLADSGKQVGDVVKLEVVREGEVLEVPVRLRARDDKQADLAGAI